MTRKNECESENKVTSGCTIQEGYLGAGKAVSIFERKAYTDCIIEGIIAGVGS